MSMDGAHGDDRKSGEGTTPRHAKDDRHDGTATPTLERIADVHAGAGTDPEQRFAFGRNWRKFLTTLDGARIQQAEQSLRTALGHTSLAGMTFLDIGSGSGLFSLAAHRLDAQVTSFDYDADSVACTLEVRKHAGAETPAWQVHQGSILNPAFLHTLGTFDIVYSWGVLHHTGAMWQAISNACTMVRPGGTLMIAIYNDQGAWSKRWWHIKRWYGHGGVIRALIIALYASYSIGRNLLADCLWLRAPWTRYREYRLNRGMSVWHDWLDWLGGFPFEVAKPEEVFHYLRERGFTLQDLTTQGGTVGCVEYRFQRTASP